MSLRIFSAYSKTIRLYFNPLACSLHFVLIFFWINQAVISSDYNACSKTVQQLCNALLVQEEQKLAVLASSLNNICARHKLEISAEKSNDESATVISKEAKLETVTFSPRYLKLVTISKLEIVTSFRYLVGNCNKFQIPCWKL